MRLRRPCEHGRYCEHYVGVIEWTDHPIWCPGGEFLADDAVIEALLAKISEGMVLWASATKWPIPDYKAVRRMIVEALDALAGEGAG